MEGTATGLSDAQIDELLSQAETRLLEKQQAQQSKVVAPRPPNPDNANSTVVAKTATSTTATPTHSNPRGQELSVRIPQVRKSKKEMVCLPQLFAATLLLPDDILSNS
jgi:hypothetical protein